MAKFTKYRTGMECGFIWLIFWVGTSTAQLNASHSPKGCESPSHDIKEVRHLFNGKDFTGLTTWLQKYGKGDPNGVFSVADGCLRLSGEGMGYTATVNSYQNYHLSVEYCWGEKTDGSGFVRNSGILLHANGPDGNANGMWMASVECQLAQGCEGDLIVIRGHNEQGKTIPVTISSDITVAADSRTRWKRDGMKSVYSGKQFWWSGHQVGFDELLDSRGNDDVASPLGKWTRVDCICDSSRITIKINGTTVNECYDVSPHFGKILLENEGNEIIFRNWKLRPLSVKNTKINKY